MPDRDTGRFLPPPTRASSLDEARTGVGGRRISLASPASDSRLSATGAGSQFGDTPATVGGTVGLQGEWTARLDASAVTGAGVGAAADAGAGYSSASMGSRSDRRLCAWCCPLRTGSDPSWPARWPASAWDGLQLGETSPSAVETVRRERASGSAACCAGAAWSGWPAARRLGSKTLRIPAIPPAELGGGGGSVT